MTQSVYFGVPQSVHRQAMEEREGNDETRKWWLSQQFTYKAQPLFMPEDKRLVIWGLDDVLTQISPEIEDSYKRHTVTALRTLNPSKAIDEAEVHRLVGESYERNGLPSRDVAEAYGVNERRLMAETMALAAYHDVSLNPAGYGMSDQGILNYFDESKKHGIAHIVVSSASTNFATTCLHFMALTQYMRSIYGMDAGTSNSPNEVRIKKRDGERILSGILASVPLERRGDVLVVDHGQEYLAAARQLGVKTAYVDLRQRHISTDPEAGTYASAKAVFEKALGIKDPGSHRDAHIYAEINMGAFQPSLA